MQSRRPTRSKLALLALPLALAVTSCATDRDHVRDDLLEKSEGAPEIRVSRTGVPILMDLPVFGFLFGQTTVVR